MIGRENDELACLASEMPLLRRAWAAVRAADGGAGRDGQTCEQFAVDTERSLDEIRQRMLRGRFRFARLRAAAIPKANGQQRTLGIPTVADRIVLQALRMVIEPACEPRMRDCSHAYRPGRGVATAVAQVAQGLAAGRTWVLETDIAKFFDSVRHPPLRRVLADMDRRTRRSPLLDGGLALSPGVWPRRLGLPQGSPLSPLLANVALTEFDGALQSAEWTLVRYADDLVVLGRARGVIEAALCKVQRSLAELGLSTHPKKTAIVDGSRTMFRFLGFEFHPDRVAPDAENLAKFRDKILAICNPHRVIAWPERVTELNAVIRSFAWYYHQTDSRRLFWTLDQMVEDQLGLLEAELGVEQGDSRHQLVKMARLREVRWAGKSKRRCPGWDGYPG